MAEKRRVQYTHRIDGRVSHIIGPWGPGRKTEAVSVQEAIEEIKSGRYIYYTLYGPQHEAIIGPRGEGSEVYLATEPDSYLPNNLSELGQCNLLEDLKPFDQPWLLGL